MITIAAMKKIILTEGDIGVYVESCRARFKLGLALLEQEKR
jgi:hypothetical protein